MTYMQHPDVVMADTRDIFWMDPPGQHPLPKASGEPPQGPSFGYLKAESSIWLSTCPWWTVILTLDSEYLGQCLSFHWGHPTMVSNPVKHLTLAAGLLLSSRGQHWDTQEIDTGTRLCLRRWRGSLIFIPCFNRSFFSPPSWLPCPTCYF